jgi:acyl-CoA dehydrogenase
MNRLQGGSDFVGAAEALFRKLGQKTSVIAVGMARAAYEYALKYSEERIAFGKPIGHFQAIAFTMSDMAMAVDAARWLVWRAATELDQGRDGRAECAMAYSHALETAMFAADWAVQILGGHGYICDHPVEKWMRDAKTLALWAGSREFANAVVADAIVGATPAVCDRLPVHDIQPVYT